MTFDGKRISFPRESFIFRAFYFFFMSAAVMKMAYPSVYFKQLGLGASYAGILSVTVPFIRGVGAPLLAYLADKTNKRKLVFLVSIAAHTVTPILLLISPTGKQLCCFSRKNQSFIETGIILSQFQNSTEKESYLRIKHGKYNHFKQIHNGRGEEIELRASENSTEKESYLKIKHGKYNHFKQIRNGRSEEIELRASENSPTCQNGNNQQASSDKPTKELQALFLILLAFYTVGEFVGAPARNLADSALLETLASESNNYGKYRLWGSVGQIILYVFITLTVRYIHVQPSCDLSIHEDYGMSLYAITLFMAVAFTFALPINFNQESYSEKISLTHKAEEMSLKDTLSNFRSVTLIIIILFLGIVDGTFFTFKFWYLTDIGPSQANWVIGVTGVACCIASVIMFGLSAKTIKAIGVFNAIHSSLFIYLFAFVLYGLITDPWLAIVPEVMQSVALAISMSASISFFFKKSPPGLSATTQGK